MTGDLLVNTAEVAQWVGQFMLPFFRITAFFFAAPIVGTQLVPARARLALGFMTAVLVAPLLPPVPVVDFVSLAAMVMILQQILIGLAMAFLLQMMFHVVAIAGQMIAMQMGLGFASMVDPANGVNVAVLGQFFLMLITLLFLSMNGHLVMIDTLIHSFHSMPIGSEGMPMDNLWALINAGGWMMGAGLMIALPAVTALLIVNITFGVMTRAAPQMNIFSLGFPFAVVFGSFIVWISLLGFLPNYHALSSEALLRLNTLVTP